MGEIADMMIYGFLDCETGEYLYGDEPGYPRTASDLLEASGGGAPRTQAQIASRRAKNKRKRDRQKAKRKAAKVTAP